MSEQLLVHERGRRYQRDPWSVPVPVRQSHFQALHVEHQALNVQVDLGQLLPFSYATEQADDEDLLYSDLQSSPTSGVGLRLGSGRAGFYRGKYLKGVGRTQLAGNWRNSNDVYHGTGHLMASGAIREYIVSCYLKKKGAGDVIVPCEGLLLAPLHKDLVGFERVAFPGQELPPIDLRFQAISVKGSSFARHSNFVWAFNQPRRLGHYGALLGSLYHYLTAACGRAQETGVGPSEIAAALSARARDGLRAYAAYFRAGVYWGSFGNNFTLDGRFLDLEVPQIFGGPFVGVIKQDTELKEDLRKTATPVIGTEAMEYLVQVQLFVRYLVRRLRFLLDTGSIPHPAEREFVAAFADAVEAEFSEEHVVMNRAAAVDVVLQGILEPLAASPGDQAALRRIVEEQYDSCVHHRPADLSMFNFRRLPLRMAKVDSVCQYHAFYPDFLPMEEGREEAEHLNRSLAELDQCTSLDQLMRGVEGLASELLRRA